MTPEITQKDIDWLVDPGHTIHHIDGRLSPGYEHHNAESVILSREDLQHVLHRCCVANLSEMTEGDNEIILEDMQTLLEERLAEEEFDL